MKLRREESVSYSISVRSPFRAVSYTVHNSVMAGGSGLPKCAKVLKLLHNEAIEKCPVTINQIHLLLPPLGIYF